MSAKDSYKPSERPWRTLIRIEGIKDGLVKCVVPGWNSSKTVSFALSLLPDDIAKKAKQGLSRGPMANGDDPVFHLFAMVNIGAEKASDLKFSEFELGLPETECCPFCGSDTIIAGAADALTVSCICYDCGASGPEIKYPDETDLDERELRTLLITRAIEGWNLRKKPTRKDSRC